jgi:hypothetical protein
MLESNNIKRRLVTVQHDAEIQHYKTRIGIFTQLDK